VKVIGIQSINHILQNSLIAIEKVIRIRFTDFRISVRGEFKMRVNIQLFIAFQITESQATIIMNRTRKIFREKLCKIFLVSPLAVTAYVLAYHIRNDPITKDRHKFFLLCQYIKHVVTVSNGCLNYVLNLV
jgi:hypothetical protein